MDELDALYDATMVAFRLARAEPSPGNVDEAMAHARKWAAHMADVLAEDVDFGTELAIERQALNLKAAKAEMARMLQPPACG